MNFDVPLIPTVVGGWDHKKLFFELEGRLDFLIIEFPKNENDSNLHFFLFEGCGIKDLPVSEPVIKNAFGICVSLIQKLRVRLNSLDKYWGIDLLFTLGFTGYFLSHPNSIVLSNVWGLGVVGECFRLFEYFFVVDSVEFNLFNKLIFEIFGWIIQEMCGTSYV